MQLLTDSHPEAPAFDMAVTEALLRGAAEGHAPEVARVYRPGRTLAFGRLDRLASGYERARSAAAARGWAPLERLGGGRAAGYDHGSVVVDVVTRTATVATGIQERFASTAALLEGALGDLGVPVELGELSREYCPGRWSLHLQGGPKVAGLAQRSIRGASLVTAVVVVSGSGPLRDVLVDVYDALGLPLDPATVGAVADRHPAVGAAQVQDAVARRLREAHGAGDAQLDEATRAAARQIG